MSTQFQELTQSLVKAWNAGGHITLPPVEAAPKSRAEAYAIQDLFAEMLGDRCVGWKVGAAVPAVQRMEGHDGPIVGRLFASRHYTSPAQVPAALLNGYKVECEFAFRFKGDVPAREVSYTREELAPILVLHPGFEIAGHRYPAHEEGRKASTYDLIADNGACGAYIEGPGIEDWSHIDLSKVPIDARIDGGEAIQVFTGEFFRDPVDILVEVVNGISARGINIAAGELLTTGSLTLPTPMQVGQTYVAKFGGLATIYLILI